MHFLGLHLPQPTTKRLVVGVVLDGTSVIDTLEHVPNPDHSQALQCREALDAVRSVLSAHQLGACVLLEGDYHPRAKVNRSAKQRLRLEGTVLAACHERIAVVQVMDGPALGRAMGTDKKAALAAGEATGVDKRFYEAAAAALAAQTL